MPRMSTKRLPMRFSRIRRNNLFAPWQPMEQKNIPNLATCLCGWTSVLTLLYITEGNTHAAFTHILYKNSGDTEYGEKGRVVGYNAIAVSIERK